MRPGESHTADTVRVDAPAKVNLWLEVLGRRPDGYHEIRTVMQTVSLCDELVLEARKDGKVVLRGSGLGLPPAEDNLVVRAARLLQAKVPCRKGARVRLTKRIPVGGGFGGGSSDCAAALRALNALWGLGLSREELQTLGAELGSDVPFFLHGGAALCEGRGERVAPLPVGGKFHYVLVMPRESVSTRGVYQALDGGLTTGSPSSSIDSVRCALATGDTGRLAASLYNALEVPALEISPGVRAVATLLRVAFPRLGCRGYSLTGSGSGFFGMFDGPEEAQDAVGDLVRQSNVAALAVQSVPADSYQR